MSKDPEIYRGTSQFTSKVAKAEGDLVTHSRRPDRHSKVGHAEITVFPSSDSKQSDIHKGLTPGLKKPQISEHNVILEGLLDHQELKSSQE